MYDYASDVNHNPPAPVIKIEINRPDNNDKKYVDALIDTGAFKSCLPLNIINDLLLSQIGEIRVTDYSKSKYETRTTYSAHIKLDEFFDDMVEIIELPNHAESIIGRDILNKLDMLLEGKNEKFEISVPE